MDEDKNLREFKVPVTWQVSASVIVAAETKEEAMKEAIKLEEDGIFVLPNDDYYIDGTFRVYRNIDFVEDIGSYY